MFESTLEYLYNEFIDKKQCQNFNRNDWFLIHEKEIPIQTNGFDYSPFVCKLKLLIFINFKLLKLNRK